MWKFGEGCRTKGPAFFITIIIIILTRREGGFSFTAAHHFPGFEGRLRANEAGSPFLRDPPTLRTPFFKKNSKLLLQRDNLGKERRGLMAGMGQRKAEEYPSPEVA